MVWRSFTPRLLKERVRADEMERDVAFRISHCNCRMVEFSQRTDSSFQVGRSDTRLWNTTDGLNSTVLGGQNHGRR